MYDDLRKESRDIAKEAQRVVSVEHAKTEYVIEAVSDLIHQEQKQFKEIKKTVY